MSHCHNPTVDLGDEVLADPYHLVLFETIEAEPGDSILEGEVQVSAPAGALNAGRRHVERQPDINLEWPERDGGPCRPRAGGPVGQMEQNRAIPSPAQCRLNEAVATLNDHWRLGQHPARICEQ